MDIEQLTKAQIVLLTLLVSFITSIATGIVTVTLMDQAPPAVTQTINRVVERTVERVVPDDRELPAAVAGSQTTREVTVVVKENDLITEAIEKNSASLVRVYKYEARAPNNVGAFAGLGFILRADGVIAMDASTLLPRATYLVTTQSGERHSARVLTLVAGVSVALLKIEKLPEGVALSAIARADLSNVKLGQTVISLSGETRTSVSVGVVTDLELTAAATSTLARIRTDISDGNVGYGSPLFNLFGEVVGIHTRAVQTPSMASYLPLSALPAIPETM